MLITMFVRQKKTMIKKITTMLFLGLLTLQAWSHGDIHHDNDPASVRFMDDSKRLPDLRYQSELRTNASWQQFLQKNGDWWVQFNETNAKPHRAFGTPVQIGIQGSAAAKAMYFLQQNAAAWLPASINLEFISSPTTKKYVHANFIQKYNGLEVLWSRATVKMTHDDKAVMFGLDVYSDISVSTVPDISAAQAAVFAGAGITSSIGNAVVKNDLKILPVPGYRGNDYHLVYEVEVSTNADGQTPDRYYTLVDAKDGKVLYRTDRIVSFASSDITATATVYPSHPYNPTTVVNLPYLQVVVGGITYNTDVNGFINFPNTNPFPATFSLQGPWAEVYTGASGSTIQNFVAQITPGTNTINFDPNSTVRHLSAYYHTNIVHDFMKARLTNFFGLDFPISVRVDRTDGTCNAFYDGGINFYTTAGGCNALSMVADVVYHEYGHGITNVYWSDNGFNFDNGGMGEGYSDIWGISITGNPVLGIGFDSSDPTVFVRTYDFANGVNRKVFPQNIVGQVHNDGEIIAGAWWSTNLLLNNLTLMTDLFAESHGGLANGPNGAEGQVYTDILIDALFADDNDANLTNGTPNAGSISTGFALHGISLLSNATLNHTPVTNATPNTPIVLDANLSNLQFAWALDGLEGAYRLNNSGTWNPIVFNNTGGNNYSVTLPPQPDGTVIAYYIGIKDVNGTLSNVMPQGANLTNPNIPYFTMVGLTEIFTEDFDANAGSWTIGLPTDGATTGEWEDAVPELTTINSSVLQTNTQVTSGGSQCFVTGADAGSAPGDNDIDNGATTITSPVFDLTSYINPTFEYFRWYTNDQGATPGTDFWQVYISNDGVTYVPVENTNVSDHSWRRFVFRFNDYLPSTSTCRIRFVAEDANAGSLVEALMDDLSLWDQTTTGITENDAFTMVNVWPNPSTDQVNLSTVLKKQSNYLLQVVNELGQVVYSENRVFNAGSQTIQIPTQGLEAGMYHLRLTGNDQQKNLKFTLIR